MALSLLGGVCHESHMPTWTLMAEWKTVQRGGKKSQKASREKQRGIDEDATVVLQMKFRRTGTQGVSNRHNKALSLTHVASNPLARGEVALVV